MTNLSIGIIVGSTRPGRVGPQVGEWVLANASAPGVDFEIVDLADYPLPLLDERHGVGAGNFRNEAANAWAAKIAELDGFLFVTGEYNHTVPGALKNSLDWLKNEWANKAAGIVSYGSMGGVRAGEHLRQIFGELQIADVRQHVMFSLFTEFPGFMEGKPVFTPTPEAIKKNDLAVLVEQVVAWGSALKGLREQQAELAA